MDSSLSGRVPEYIGADLTDRYSTGCRDVDVCGLTPGENNALMAKFWRWRWDAAPRPLDVTAIACELAAARAAMIDGPQGLASNGNRLRTCERQSAAVGKTPDVRPELTKPFAGFICSSLDLFGALKRAGTVISPASLLGGVSEVYPGHIWTILSGQRALPNKSTENGRLARKLVLETLGVSGLPAVPSHDQNDACVAALLAAAADCKVAGVTTTRIGLPLSLGADTVLREGPMVIPQVSTEISELISRALRNIPLIDVTVSKAGADPSGPTDPNANDLLNMFIDRAIEGNPHVCTYSWAYRSLFNSSYGKWSQAYANQVIEVARRSSLRKLDGLGLVRLDTFVVSKSDGLPSIGHWSSARYDREDWERVLGQAAVLD